MTQHRSRVDRESSNRRTVTTRTNCSACLKQRINAVNDLPHSSGPQFLAKIVGREEAPGLGQDPDDRTRDPLCVLSNAPPDSSEIAPLGLRQFSIGPHEVGTGRLPQNRQMMPCADEQFTGIRLQFDQPSGDCPDVLLMPQQKKLEPAFPIGHLAGERRSLPFDRNSSPARL